MSIFGRPSPSSCPTPTPPASPTVSSSSSVPAQDLYGPKNPNSLPPLPLRITTSSSLLHRQPAHVQSANPSPTSANPRLHTSRPPLPDAFPSSSSLSTPSSSSSFTANRPQLVLENPYCTPRQLPAIVPTFTPNTTLYSFSFTPDVPSTPRTDTGASQTTPLSSASYTPLLPETITSQEGIALTEKGLPKTILQQDLHQNSQAPFSPTKSYLQHSHIPSLMSPVTKQDQSANHSHTSWYPSPTHNVKCRDPKIHNPNLHSPNSHDLRSHNLTSQDSEGQHTKHQDQNPTNPEPTVPKRQESRLGKIDPSLSLPAKSPSPPAMSKDPISSYHGVFNTFPPKDVISPFSIPSPQYYQQHASLHTPSGSSDFGSTGTYTKPNITRLSPSPFQSSPSAYPFPHVMTPLSEASPLTFSSPVSSAQSVPSTARILDKNQGRNPEETEEQTRGRPQELGQPEQSLSSSALDHAHTSTHSSSGHSSMSLSSSARITPSPRDSTPVPIRPNPSLPHRNMDQSPENDQTPTPETRPLPQSTTKADLLPLIRSSFDALPLPICIVNSRSQLVHANTSMEKLLGLPRYTWTAGRTLAQIGLDLCRHNQPLHVHWDVFFESICENHGSRKPSLSHLIASAVEDQHALENLDPYTSPSSSSSSSPDQDETGSFSVDVMIIYPDPFPMAWADRGSRQRDATYAKMMITPWTDEIHHQHFFTLTFSEQSRGSYTRPLETRLMMLTSDCQHAPPAQSTVRDPFMTESSSPPAPTTLASSSSQQTASFRDALGVDAVPHSKPVSDLTPAPLSAPPTAPEPLLYAPAAESKGGKSAGLSSSKKLSALKDAILESTEVPVMGMWKDGSVIYANQASRDMFSLQNDSDVMSDVDTPFPTSAVDLSPCTTFISMSSDSKLSHEPTVLTSSNLHLAIPLWTEDFQRRIVNAENPLVRVAQTGLVVEAQRFGYELEDGRRIVYEVHGETICDEDTGEFLAGFVHFRDVTDWRQEVTQLKEEDAERFQLICDSLPHIVWTTDEMGRVLYFNSHWYDYTGLTPKESLMDRWLTAIHPGDMDELSERWDASLNREQKFYKELRLRNRQGEYRWFLSRALPLRDKATGQIRRWYGTSTDVHERYLASVKAMQVRQQLLGVLAHASVTLFTVNMDSKVTLLEGSLVWDTPLEERANQWFLDQSVYDVFERITADFQASMVRKASESPTKSATTNRTDSNSNSNSHSNSNASTSTPSATSTCHATPTTPGTPRGSVSRPDRSNHKKKGGARNQSKRTRSTSVLASSAEERTEETEMAKEAEKIEEKLSGKDERTGTAQNDQTKEEKSDVSDSSQLDSELDSDSASDSDYDSDEEESTTPPGSPSLNPKSKPGIRRVPPFLEPLPYILDGTRREAYVEHAFGFRWYRTLLLPLWQKTRVASSAGDEEKQLDGAIGIIVDITEIRVRQLALEAEARRKREAIAKEEAAIEANILKGKFLANMSHEIRTPISGVIGMTEILASTTMTEEQRDYVDNVRRSAETLLTVVNDILDYSKMEQGRMDMNFSEFSLPLLVHNVKKMMEFAAIEKELDLQAVISDNIPRDMRLVGDLGRLRQVLFNLMMNSIKFTEEGFVRLATELEEMDEQEMRKTIEMIDTRTKGKIRVRGKLVLGVFKIEDSGIGLSDEFRTQLYEPFSQADSSTIRRFGGTGLGLSICKRLVEMMFGTISLDSVKGLGTTVTIRIPFQKPRRRLRSSTSTFTGKARSSLSRTSGGGGYDSYLGKSVTVYAEKALVAEELEKTRKLKAARKQARADERAEAKKRERAESNMTKESGGSAAGSVKPENASMEYHENAAQSLESGTETHRISPSSKTPDVPSPTPDMSSPTPDMPSSTNGMTKPKADVNTLLPRSTLKRSVSSVIGRMRPPQNGSVWVPDSEESEARNRSHAQFLANKLPMNDRGKLHILVVEDNQVNQKIALKLVQKLGFTASAVWNGQEALQYMLDAERSPAHRRHHHHRGVSGGDSDGQEMTEETRSPYLLRRPDIILMDVQMPLIDGYRCTEILRKNPPYVTLARGIPVIALTASAIEGDQERCLSYGMDDYLSKPIKTQHLEEILVRWCTTVQEGWRGQIPSSSAMWATAPLGGERKTDPTGKLRGRGARRGTRRAETLYDAGEAYEGGDDYCRYADGDDVVEESSGEERETVEHALGYADRDIGPLLI